MLDIHSLQPWKDYFPHFSEEGREHYERHNGNGV
jgi:hypothetical protein